MILKELIADLEIKCAEGDLNISVTGITFDSRLVREGNIFIAMPGEVSDGNDFVDSAIEKGAAAIISNLEPVDEVKASWIQVDDPRRVLASVARKFYEKPDEKLTLAGITGTNGKTTVANLVRAIFEDQVGPTGMIGTISYDTGQELTAARLTTPEANESLAMMHEMLNSGKRAAVMEVSSVASHRYRVENFAFDALVFTNLSRDHLDYHGDMESYYQAKKRLFRVNKNSSPTAVINIDDPWGERLAEEAEIPLITFGFSKDVECRCISSKVLMSGLEMQVAFRGQDYQIYSQLIGEFNLENVLAAFATAAALELDLQHAAESISRMRPVKGRMEPVKSDKEFLVLVDYAHTDDALKKILEAANRLTDHRVIVLFGCGGDKDKGKRPLMGKHAVRLSDIAILTSDNPRSEDPLKIIEDVKAGIDELEEVRAELIIEPDRRLAIIKAINSAGPGDIVLLAGKGHEDYQITGGSTIHFDDREVASKALRTI